MKTEMPRRRKIKLRLPPNYPGITRTTNGRILLDMFCSSPNIWPSEN